MLLEDLCIKLRKNISNMKVFKNLINGTILGITLGLLISLFFSYIFNTNYLVPSSPRFVMQFSTPLNAIAFSIVLWGFMGLLFSLANYIFYLDRLSITKQTIYHFIVTYFGYTSLAIMAGWFPKTMIWLSVYTIIFILIYCLIWIISMREAKKLTDSINKLIDPHS